MPHKELPVLRITHFQQVEAGKDFYANRIPAHLRDHHFIHEPHKHDFYLVVFFTQGSGTHEIDFSSYKVKPGSVFFLSPGQTHNWKLSADIDGYVFFHSEEFYNLNFSGRQIKDYPFFSSIYNSPLLQLKQKAVDKRISLFAEIVEEYEKNETMKFQKIAALADLLYIGFSRKYTSESTGIHPHENYLQKLRKLEELINTNFRSVKSPAEYASMMNMSEKHLNRICKTVLNKTTTDLIADRVILEAKRMLVHARHTVAEVAGGLGYFDTSYFIRLFKKRSGETPARFMTKYT